MNNGYGVRDSIRINERPYKRLTPIKRDISLANGIVKPELPVKSDDYQEPVLPSALPTIPIYKCSPSKPCCESNPVGSRPIGYKTINSAIANKSGSKGYVLKGSPNSNKSAVSHSFNLVKSIDGSFDFEKEPPTIKTETESEDDEHSIKKHRKPLIMPFKAKI